MFVLIVLPLLLGPFLTNMVRDAGLKSDTLSVTVAPFDPTLLLGKAREITLIATDVDASPATIGSVNLAIGDANYFDRSFKTVSRHLDDVSVTVNGTDSAHRRYLRRRSGECRQRDGPSLGDRHGPAHSSRRRTCGLDDRRRPRSATAASPSRSSGVDANAQLAVSGGALVLDPGVGGAIVLLQPAPSDPWTLRRRGSTPTD